MIQTIYAKDLVKKYGRRTVVNRVSFHVGQGEIVGLLGPNGAGKTTSFYQVVGLVRPDSGNVFLNDQNITRMAMYKRARLGIGYFPQEPSVFRKLSVEDNIAAVLEMTDLSKKDQKARCETLIEEFHLETMHWPEAAICCTSPPGPTRKPTDYSGSWRRFRNHRPD